jgi:hypothetical protein
MAHRRRVRLITSIAVGVATVAALAVGLFLLVRFERVDERYDTHAALATNHPELAQRLPANVTQIRVRYYIDAPDRWVAFRSPSMPTRLGGSKDCRPAAAPEVRFATRGPSWWPKKLTDTTLGGWEGFQFARCELDPPYPAYQGRPTSWIAFRASDGKAIRGMSTRPSNKPLERAGVKASRPAYAASAGRSAPSR